jgi:hypothetical protein
MSPARAVQLMANAMAAGVEEAWLAKQPVLTMGEIRLAAGLIAWLVVRGRHGWLVDGMPGTQSAVSATCWFCCTTDCA